MSIVRIIKKFSLILSSHQKLRIIELGLLMIVGGVLETLSVSLFLPFMDVVMNPEATMEKPYVKAICDTMSITTSKSFIVLLSLVLAALYMLKNVYLLLEFNIQYRFVYGNMFAMQRRLLDVFINRPYEYYLGINTGETIRIINTDTAQVFSLLSVVLDFFIELVVSGMLIIAVFMMAPIITVVMAAVLLLLVIVINRVIKPVLHEAGINTQNSGAGMNKWLLQSVQGIKELKVTNKGNFFEENYNRHGEKYANSLRKSIILSIIPRLIIEASCMSTLFIMIGFFVYRGSDIEGMIPVLSAVAVAAMRLLPSVNRISKALANISYGEPMLDKLIENLKSAGDCDSITMLTDASDYKKKIKSEGYEDKSRGIPDFKRLIEFKNISYKYPSGEGCVLRNASMTIEYGQSIGLIGATGSGKTTSVDLLLGLLLPQEGQILVDGYDIKNDIPGWLRQIGYIPQDIFMLDDTIRANVAFGESEVNEDEVWRALSEAAIDGFVRSLPEGLDTRIGERGVRLSGGQRQRIGIARALYNDPDVLFFDEATSALDNETEAAIMESINGLRGKKTMIIIAHRLTTIEFCDCVYRVENGKIQSGQQFRDV